MRYSLEVDDEIVETLRETVTRTGRSFERVVNDTLRAGIASERKQPRPRRYRLKPSCLGGVRPGIDLDQALKISDLIEDQEISREVQESE